MNRGQKVIKIIAIVIAVMLSITIISSIVAAVSSIFIITNIVENTNNESVVKNIDVVNQIEDLKINVGASKICIKEGEKLQISTNSKYIVVNEENNKLSIKETSHFNFSNPNLETTVYVPKDFKFKQVKINVGAGELNIASLIAEKLELSLGAGTTTIDYVSATSFKAETGAGKLNIKNGLFEKAKLDMGVGNIDIESKIGDFFDIDAGIGNLNLKLLGNKEEYTLDIDKGVGNVSVDGVDVSNVIGNGSKHIKIDGGIGNIDINFIKYT